MIRHRPIPQAALNLLLVTPGEGDDERGLSDPGRAQARSAAAAIEAWRAPELSMAAVYPRLARHYPETIAEVAYGLQITMWPLRGLVAGPGFREEDLPKYLALGVESLIIVTTRFNMWDNLKCLSPCPVNPNQATEMPGGSVCHVEVMYYPAERPQMLGYRPIAQLA